MSSEQRWCEKQGGKLRGNVCEVPDKVVNATLKNALIHAMGADFLLTKDGKQVRLIMEQHPNYRTALYPVLDAIEGREKDFDEIWRELTVRHGYTLGDFSGARVFKTANEAMDFVVELERKKFVIAIEPSGAVV